MSDESWEEQFKQFLRKTGEDVRRTGEDVRAEAQRLLDAAMDPEKQQRVRNRLQELTDWARKTAHGVAGAVEGAASKAETVFYRAADKVTEATEKVMATQHTPSAAEAPAHKPAAATKKASKAKVKSGKARPKSAGKARPKSARKARPKSGGKARPKSGGKPRPKSGGKRKR